MMVMAMMPVMMVAVVVLGLGGGSQHAQGKAGDEEVCDFHERRENGMKWSKRKSAGL
jgi:hypothetical protein